MLSKRKGMGQPLDEQEWPRAGKQERGALHEKRGAPKFFKEALNFEQRKKGDEVLSCLWNLFHKWKRRAFRVRIRIHQPPL